MKLKNLLSLLLLCVLSLSATGCSKDDEPDNNNDNGGGTGGALVINGIRTDDARISVFSYSYGSTYFSYDLFVYGDEGLYNFDFDIEGKLSSKHENSDIAEDIYVHGFRSYTSLETIYDYEYVSGSVIVKSVSDSKIVLQFKDYIFTKETHSGNNQTTFKVNGTATFTRDGQ